AGAGLHRGADRLAADCRHALVHRGRGRRRARSAAASDRARAGDRVAAGRDAGAAAGAGDERDDRPAVRARSRSPGPAARARGLARRAEGGAAARCGDVRPDDRHPPQRIVRGGSDHSLAGTRQPDAAGAAGARHLSRRRMRRRGRAVPRARHDGLRRRARDRRSARARPRVVGRGCRMTRRAGVLLIAAAIVAALAAPVLGPHAPDARDRSLLNAPPTWPHFVADDGSWHAPFIYRRRIVSRLEQSYEQDRSARIPLAFFSSGHLLQSSNEADAPLFLLGADSFGRDVLSRLLYGARISLGLAAVAALGATLIGAAVGG